MARSVAYSFIILFLLQACKKDNIETANRNIGKTYFNTALGSYSIYNVEEIIYNDFFNTIDTLKYELMEKNDTFFDDNIGRKSIRIERYKRNNDTAKWLFLNIWYSTTNNSIAERIEENKRLVKISFPLAQDAVWNYNAYNTDNGMYVYYEFLHQKYFINNFTFDSTIAIKSESIINLTKERQYQEIYANHIGLVYKYQVNIDKNGTIKRGYKIKQTILKHEP